MTRLAFVSGKGGSGKTSVILTSASLLSAAGYSVLMVDADHSTFGLSHYLAAELEAAELEVISNFQNASTIALYDLPVLSLDSAGSEPSPVYFASLRPLFGRGSSAESRQQAIQGSLAYIFAERQTERLQNAVTVLKTHEVDERQALNVDFVLVDLPAGSVDMLGNSLRSFDAFMLVTEADPVSISASSAMRNEIKGAPVYGLVNKVFEGEESYIDALANYVTDVRFVGQVPFDMDIRRAFFSREFPLLRPAIDPVSLGLARSFSRLTRIRSDIEMRMDDRIASPLQTRIAEAERRLHSIEDRYEAAEQKTARLARLANVFQMLLACLLGALIALDASDTLNKGFVIALPLVVGLLASLSADALGLSLRRRRGHRDDLLLRDVERERRLLERSKLR